MPEAVQTSVGLAPAIGLPGMPADSGPIDSKTLIATVDIPFGAFVYESAEGKCALPTATGNVTGVRGGVAMRDPSLASGVGYKVGDPVRVLLKGRVFVLNEEAVTFDDPVFVRHASGAGGTQLGAFRDDADTATASTPPNHRWFRGGNINLAILEAY
jgi:hypothetical protein